MHPPPLFASAIAIVSVIVTVALQAATFVPGLSLSSSIIVPVFLVTLVSFCTASSLANHFFSNAPYIRTGKLLKDWGEVEREKWRYQAKVFDAVSWPWRGLILFLAAYAVFSVVMYAYQTQGATPVADQRSFYLSANGKYIRALTPLEFQSLQTLKIRAWSAALLLASSISFIGTNIVYPTIAHEIYTAYSKFVRDINDQK